MIKSSSKNISNRGNIYSLDTKNNIQGSSISTLDTNRSIHY